MGLVVAIACYGARKKGEKRASFRTNNDGANNAWTENASLAQGSWRQNLAQIKCKYHQNKNKEGPALPSQSCHFLIRSFITPRLDDNPASGNGDKEKEKGRNASFSTIFSLFLVLLSMMHCSDFWFRRTVRKTGQDKAGYKTIRWCSSVSLSSVSFEESTIKRGFLLHSAVTYFRRHTSYVVQLGYIPWRFAGMVRDQPNSILLSFPSPL